MGCFTLTYRRATNPPTPFSVSKSDLLYRFSPPTHSRPDSYTLSSQSIALRLGPCHQPTRKANSLFRHTDPPTRRLRLPGPSNNHHNHHHSRINVNLAAMPASSLLPRPAWASTTSSRRLARGPSARSSWPCTRFPARKSRSRSSLGRS